jgi:WxcM-like, C-terminal
MEHARLPTITTSLKSQAEPAGRSIRGLLSACRLIELPKINDPRGNLTFVEGGKQIPFEIKRVYYLYDVPGGSDRGGHSHKELHQLLIAMSGSFDVVLDDGRRKVRKHLNRSYYGLYIPPLVWRELDNFSSGSVCLALASEVYQESDYFRDYEEYLQAMRAAP